MRASFFALAVALIVGFASLPAQADLESYAVVRDDGSLLIRRKVVHLYGVYIPDTRQFCRSNILPATCGTRAAVALRQKISKFVRCEPIVEYDDGSLGAQCWTNYSRFSDGEDLGAFLISQGFAAAGPDASYEYHLLERMALANGRGIWGFPADSVRSPRSYRAYRYRY
jgi:Micrococcal nuclease (thermonuclease) homologs